MRTDSLYWPFWLRKILTLTMLAGLFTLPSWWLPELLKVFREGNEFSARLVRDLGLWMALVVAWVRSWEYAVRDLLLLTAVADRFVARAIVENLWSQLEKRFGGDQLSARKTLRRWLVQMRQAKDSCWGVDTRYREIQKLADYLLHEYAENFLRCAAKQEGVRAIIGGLKKAPHSYSADQITSHFEEMAKANEDLRKAESRFWKAHFMVEASGLRVWPKVGAYVALNVEG